MQTTNNDTLPGTHVRYDNDARGTHVLTWDCVSHMAQDAHLCALSSRVPFTKVSQMANSKWIGRQFASVDDVWTAPAGSWAEGMRTVNQMMEQIGHDVPAPKSRKRVGRWSADNGEIEIDRVLRGEYEYMRDHKRQSAHAPATISLICNVGGVGGVTAEEMFWRSAAALCVIDALEDAGYGVEVWMWNRAHNTYQGYGGNVFQACRLKNTDDVLDKNLIVNALSPWYFRTINHASRHVLRHETVAYSYGQSEHHIGNFRKYMDVTESHPAYEMPVSTTSREAIENARKLLETIAADSQ